jgi:competence protein ComEC
MVGIFLFYPTVEKSIYFPNKLLQTIWSGTAIGISAQLMTTPISLYYFHQFPNYFMLTNIGLMATSGVILGLGLFIFSISWWHFLANLTGIVLTFILFATYYFIEWVENLPGGVAQGFELPFELVVSITVLIVCLFTITRYKVVTALLFTLGLVFVSIVVYMRYENLTKEEIVVYNARQVIVTIRKNDQLFCFYDCKKSDFPKVQFALDSYLKLHPGKVHYFPMSQKNWHIQSEKLAIQTTKMASNFVVSLNNKKHLIYRNDYSNPHELLESKQLTVIGMPWIEGKVDHSLNDGAYMAGI